MLNPIYISLIVAFITTYIYTRFSLEIIDSSFLDNQSSLNCIIKLYGFNQSNLNDGLIILIFSLSFIYIINLITVKRMIPKLIPLHFFIILIYIVNIFYSDKFLISLWLQFLLIGIINSIRERKNAVLYLVFGNLINFMFSMILISVLILYYKYYLKNYIYYNRFLLIMIDSIFFSVPLMLFLGYICA